MSVLMCSAESSVMHMQVELCLNSFSTSLPQLSVSACCHWQMCTLSAVLSQRWCCQINQSLYVHVICCPLTTLVLSDEAVCARHVLFFTTGWTAGGHWWTTRVAKDVSDQGDQHNNGPHQILDNPSALCLTMWATNQIRFGVGRIDSPDKLFMNGVGLIFSPLFPSSDWVSLRSSRSKYKASTITPFFLFLFFFFFSTLRSKTVWINLSSKKKTKKNRRKKIVVHQLHRFLFSFFFFLFFLTTVSRRLEPLKFISREHSPMLSESATYYSVVFCR